MARLLVLLLLLGVILLVWWLLRRQPSWGDVEAPLQAAQARQLEGHLDSVYSVQEMYGVVDRPGEVVRIPQGHLFNGEIIAHQVLVDGSVDGVVRAEASVQVGSHASVDGEVHAPRINIEEGASFKAKVIQG